MNRHFGEDSNSTVAKPSDQRSLQRQAADGTGNSELTGLRPLVVLSANSCWNLVNFRPALLSGLQSAGYRIAAFAPLDPNAGLLRSWGIEVHDMPMARSGMNPAADARLLLRYLRTLRRLRPTAYCGFTIKPNVYGAAAARLAAVPAINNVTGLGTAFLSKGLMWRFTARLYRWAFRRSHRVFFHNREDLQIFIRHRIVRPEQGRVIPGSGINLDEFRPEGEGHDPAGAPRFLFIGRAIRDKGIAEYVEAARLLRRRMPEVRFQILGNPDPGNRTSVSIAQFQSWIDEGLIEHVGEHADVRPFIRAATAVVLPSYREGMSRALLEGAAMGKPLVGSDVAGCRELVEDGVTGALCRVRDAQSLAEAMERIARLPPERLRALGRAARDKVEREFGEQIVVDAYLEALAEVAAR
jgi:glycosyltransferase involved in cell wall biosynthesis